MTSNNAVLTASEKDGAVELIGRHVPYDTIYMYNWMQDAKLLLIKLLEREVSHDAPVQTNQ